MAMNGPMARSLGENSGQPEMVAPATAAEGAPRPAGPAGDDQAESADVPGEDWVEAEQETEPLRSASAPERPSAAEVEEHRITHTPYRAWCDECRRGRGLGEQRGRHRGRHHAIPRVGIEYWYITSGGMVSRKDLGHPQTTAGDQALEQERQERKVMKCLIIRCHESKALFAHCIPCKGADEDKYVASLITSDVAFMGHVKLILKSDNEAALLTLVRAALQEIRCTVPDVTHATSEEAAAYESASNGGTECGIREVRGLFRTLKLDLERRIGYELLPCHPLLDWLVEHSAMLITAMHVGTDGKTAWSRLRGRGFGQRLVGFGESVLYKQPPKGPQHDVHGNMGARMFIGTFVGFHKTSNAYRVLTAEGFVVKTRGLLRRSLADRWQPEVLKGVTATPWSLRPAAEPAQARALGEQVAPHAPEVDGPIQARRLKITMKLLREHGTTDACPQCSHVRAFDEHKPGISHSDACRKRLMDALNATDDGSARLERYEERIDRALASHDPSAASGPGTHVPHGASSDGVRGATGAPSEEAHPAEAPGPSQRDHWPAGEPSEDGRSVVDDAMGDDAMVSSVAELRKRTEQSVAHMEQLEEREREDVVQVLAMLGGDPRSFRREQKQAVRRIVSDIDFRPRSQ